MSMAWVLWPDTRIVRACIRFAMPLLEANPSLLVREDLPLLVPDDRILGRLAELQPDDPVAALREAALRGLVEGAAGGSGKKGKKR